MQTCFFIGHREAPDDLYHALYDAVLRHIEAYGVTDYVVGHYGRFDAMAARAVREAKKIHPEVRLSLLLPYHPAEREVWHPEQYDSLFYPPGMETVPRRAAIVRANRYMVDHSTHLIAYAWHPASNARELVEYAMRRGVSVYNLHNISNYLLCTSLI